jgi:hypothetical protein
MIRSFLTAMLAYAFGFVLGAYVDEIHYAFLHYGPGLSLVW